MQPPTYPEDFDPSTLRMCIDRVIPDEDVVKAAELAVAENPENDPFKSHPYQLAQGADPVQAAILTSKKWANGRVLNVRFMGGNLKVHQRLIPFAKRWEKFANITFVFDNAANAELRVAFDPSDGSWSMVGTDALTVPRSEATMNFGWLTPTLSDEEYASVVCHEFGHSLGLVHEHQSPAEQIPWNIPLVYKTYQGPPNNWTKAMIDANIFNKYSSTQTQYTAFDINSIMLYPVAAALTIGGFSTPWNNTISELDANFIGEQYPKPGSPVATPDPNAPTPTPDPGPVAPDEISLVANGPAVRSSFSAGGGKLYRVNIGQAGIYRIIALPVRPSGPQLMVTLMAGAGSSEANVSRVTSIYSRLGVGSYRVKVTSFNKNLPADYNIAVRRMSR